MTIDGAIMLTSKDNFFYHEMISHPVLFTHAAPKRVVIIGGGDCGTLREVLKHTGVESVTQCDIDEQVTVMARKHFRNCATPTTTPAPSCCSTTAWPTWPTARPAAWTW